MKCSINYLCLQQDNWKVDSLFNDTNKLHREVNELKFMDDLLKLLSGKLEKVSMKDWPFVIRNAKSGIEELNLIV